MNLALCVESFGAVLDSRVLRRILLGANHPRP